MADDVVPDRLAFIKSVFAENPGWVNVDEVRWLIAEVERLRAIVVDEVARAEDIERQAEAEFVALRGALQALVDATGRAAIDDGNLAAARAVAVAVLTGQETELTGENLRDSGMGQPGGVSDGPQ